jgi:hypothetical protein
VKTAAFIINIFLPGAGTILIGKIPTGIVQLALYGLAHLLMWTVVGILFGLPLLAIVWLWGLITVATTPVPPPPPPQQAV